MLLLLLMFIYRYFSEYVQNKRQQGQVDADSIAAETQLDILGHSGHARSNVDGHKHPAQNDQDEQSAELEAGCADSFSRT